MESYIYLDNTLISLSQANPVMIQGEKYGLKYGKAGIHFLLFEIKSLLNLIHFDLLLECIGHYVWQWNILPKFLHKREIFIGPKYIL